MTQRSPVRYFRTNPEIIRLAVMLHVRSRGVRLSDPNGAEALRRTGTGAQALREAVSGNADEYAAGLAEGVRPIRADGHSSLRALAEQMNERGILTRRGRRWHVSNIRNLLERLNGG